MHIDKPIFCDRKGKRLYCNCKTYLAYEEQRKNLKRMLGMYSSDMAARIYQCLSEVQELAILCAVPYLNGSAKISFERANCGMK